MSIDTSICRNIIGFKDFPIAFWDERLSTVAAEKILLEADIIENAAAK